jgi:signal transduction histidine kinase
MHEKGTILVVDDMPANLDILFKYLREAGFKVLIAGNGERALDQAAYAQPDIILLDVMMPKLDGFETCRRLKENEATREIPVIFITALSNTQDKLKGFEVGGVDYVTKPIEHQEMLARVTMHLTIRNLQRSLQAEVAERQKVETALRVRNEELDAFAHTVAHNLKNSLSLITSAAEYLADEYETMSPAEAKPLLKQIMQSGHKTSATVEALLLLAKVRQKKEVAVRPLDMAQIIDAVQQRLAGLIAEKKAKLILPSSWPPACGYSPWVEEVWLNYLSNGLKYGGRPPRLELGGQVEANGMARFWVKDNGSGLTPEEQTQLFVPFIRLQKVQTQEGHGLGLSIVLRIVEKLGGEVGLSSEVGQGSRFSFTLPVG